MHDSYPSERRLRTPRKHPRRPHRRKTLGMETTHAFPRIRVAGPEGWVDESVISFVAPAKNGLAANVVITSAELDSDDWKAEVDRDLRELKKQARGYRRVEDNEISHLGDPARRVEHA